jgi:hypothetical protein
VDILPAIGPGLQSSGTLATELRERAREAILRELGEPDL